MPDTLKKASLKYQLKSFRWAFNGLSEFFRTEIKARIHLIASILVLILGIYLDLTLVDWVLITLAIGIVFITEIINTAIEEIANCIPDKFDSARGKIKDLSAGAVLLASIMASIIGGFVILPHFFKLCNELITHI